MFPDLHSHGDGEEEKRELFDVLINRVLSAKAASQLDLDQVPTPRLG
jgi:hypothetical protein